VNKPESASSPESDTLGYYRRMQSAVEELLILKGVISQADVEREAAALKKLDYRRGARMVARAWIDPAYKKRMLAAGSAAAQELGLDVGPMHLLVVENTPKLHNVIVCTLCSCYPRLLLGAPPPWYKSREYRSRTVREPRKVLEEFGTRIADDVEIRVHEPGVSLRVRVNQVRLELVVGEDPDERAVVPSQAVFLRDLAVEGGR
jgi:nitrile hydratase